jgi:hypothetical protein
MKLLAFALLFTATQASALTAPLCQLTYKPNTFSPTDAPVASIVSRPATIPGVAGKASTVFAADGAVQTVTAAAEDDRNGVTKLTISVDLANGSFASNDTFFVNTFNDYRGQKVTMFILRPEGQVRFNFPQPSPLPGQPPTPPAPVTFRGSANWSAAATAQLMGKVINQIEVDCSSDPRDLK